MRVMQSHVLVIILVILSWKVFRLPLAHCAPVSLDCGVAFPGVATLAAFSGDLQFALSCLMDVEAVFLE